MPDGTSGLVHTHTGRGEEREYCLVLFRLLQSPVLLLFSSPSGVRVLTPFCLWPFWIFLCWNGDVTSWIGSGQLAPGWNTSLAGQRSSSLSSVSLFTELGDRGIKLVATLGSLSTVVAHTHS